MIKNTKNKQVYMCLLEEDIGNLMIGLLIVSMKILES